MKYAYLVTLMVFQVLVLRLVNAQGVTQSKNFISDSLHFKISYKNTNVISHPLVFDNYILLPSPEKFIINGVSGEVIELGSPSTANTLRNSINDTLVIYNHRNYVFIQNILTGDILFELFRKSRANRFTSPYLITDDLFFIMSNDQTFQAFQTNGFKKMWEIKSSGVFWPTYVNVENAVVFGDNNFIYKYDLSGNLIWSRSIPGGMGSDMLVYENTIIAWAAKKGVAQINIETGELNWVYDGNESTQKHGRWTKVILAGSDVIFGEDGIKSVNLNTRKINWQINSFLGNERLRRDDDIWLLGNLVFYNVTFDDSAIFGICSVDGEQLWYSTSLPYDLSIASYSFSPRLIDNNIVVAYDGSTNSGIVAFKLIR